MTFREFVEKYDHSNSIILLEGKRNVVEGDTIKLEALGKLLANNLKKATFRSGIDLQNFLENIYTIYVTPDDEEYNNIWEDFKNQHKDKGKHLRWAMNDTNEDIRGDETKNNHSVDKILIQLSEKETNGSIEPIPDYTKHTVKAFLNFIDNDFQSIVDEENSGRKNEKKDRVDKDTFFEYISGTDENVGEQLSEVDEQLTYLKIPSFQYFTRKQKRLSYFLNEKSKMFFFMDTNINNNTLVVNYLRNEKSKDTDIEHVNDSGKVWFRRSFF